MDECFSSQTKPSLFRVPHKLQVHLLRNVCKVQASGWLFCLTLRKKKRQKCVLQRPETGSNKVSVNRGERQAKEMQLSCQLCKRVRNTRCCRFYVDGEERDKRRRHKRRVFSRASASSYAHRTISTQNTYAHRTIRAQNNKHTELIRAQNDTRTEQ